MSGSLGDPQFFAAVALTAATLTAVITYVTSRLLIRFLSKRGRVVADFHKPGKPMIPKPGGPAIILGLVAGETLLYLFTQQTSLLALVATLIIAGAIGLLDDTVTLGGTVKPALLVLASLPILILGTYDFSLAFPFFGTVRLSIIYPMLVLLAIPVTSNTVNTIDVLNGVVSGFILIASIPLILALLLFGDFVAAAAAIIFATATASFYFVHKYPSKIFPGDSGSLVLGAGYGALAIIGRVEIIAVVALLPAILNSFFFLSTVKRLVEHRKVKERPITVGEDGLLTASRKSDAPISLVRLILAKKPMFEHQVAMEILKLAAFSAILAALTALTIRGI